MDKQAAARCWRDGNARPCYTYRLLTAGTIEEKIYQRQLAKEGLAAVVEDRAQSNAFDASELRDLGHYRRTLFSALGLTTYAR